MNLKQICDSNMAPFSLTNLHCLTYANDLFMKCSWTCHFVLIPISKLSHSSFSLVCKNPKFHKTNGNHLKFQEPFHFHDYHNPNLGFATKARACKGAGQEGSLRVTSHALVSTKECEGMNLHIPKWTPILGIEVPNGLLNFQRAITRVKSHWIETFLVSLKISWT
jgi:hypothetical protein